MTDNGHARCSEGREKEGGERLRLVKRVAKKSRRQRHLGGAITGAGREKFSADLWGGAVIITKIGTGVIHGVFTLQYLELETYKIVLFI